MSALPVWLVPAIVLLAAAALKAADRTGAAVALAAYGDARAGWPRRPGRR